MINMNQELLDNQESLIKNLQNQVELLEGIIQNHEQIRKLMEERIAHLEALVS